MIDICITSLDELALWGVRDLDLEACLRAGSMEHFRCNVFAFYKSLQI